MINHRKPLDIAGGILSSYFVRFQRSILQLVNFLLPETQINNKYQSKKCTFSRQAKNEPKQIYKTWKPSRKNEVLEQQRHRITHSCAMLTPMIYCTYTNNSLHFTTSKYNNPKYSLCPKLNVHFQKSHRPPRIKTEPEVLNQFTSFYT